MGKNRLLEKDIMDILRVQVPGRFDYKVEFFSPSTPSYKYSPLFLEDNSTLQNFTGSIGDAIYIAFNISGKAMRDFYKYQGDLMATFTHTYVSVSSTNVITDPPPIVRTYRAIILTPGNIERQLQDVHDRVEEDRIIYMQLIEPELYTARQVEISGIFKDANVDPIIRHCVSKIGFKVLDMVPPDNLHTFRNLNIPHTLSMSNVFLHLQNEYGVYYEGITSYFTDGILNIYPPYSFKPRFPYKLNIYLDDYGSHAGMSSYHRFRDKNLDIVIQGNPKIYDLTTEAGENRATGYSFLRASKIIDGFIKTGVNTITTNDSLLDINIVNPKTATPGRYKPKHIGSTDNIYAATTQLMKFNAELLEIEWQSAIPFSIEPGMPLTYYHGKDETIEAVNGIVETVAYKSVRGPNGSFGRPVFSVTASLRIRLEPYKKQEQESGA